MDSEKISLPKHYPVISIKKEGVLSTNENVFIYFPYSTSKKEKNIEKHFSFEFLDVTKKIYNNVILRCCDEIFENASLINELLSKELEYNTYLFSYFHELGHQVGPWKATPSKHPNLKVNWKLHAIMGELSADLMISKAFPEFRIPNLLNLLGKMFFYGRKGFKKNNHQGLINEDCDSWGGVYLLNEVIKSAEECKKDDNKFKLDLFNSFSIFDDIFDEIHLLGKKIISEKSYANQEIILNEWMNSKMPKVNGKFELPSRVRSIFKSLEGINENL